MELATLVHGPWQGPWTSLLNGSPHLRQYEIVIKYAYILSEAICMLPDMLINFMIVCLLFNFVHEKYLILITGMTRTKYIDSHSYLSWQLWPVGVLNERASRALLVFELDSNSLKFV